MSVGGAYSEYVGLVVETSHRARCCMPARHKALVAREMEGFSSDYFVFGAGEELRFSVH